MTKFLFCIYRFNSFDRYFGNLKNKNVLSFSKWTTVPKCFKTILKRMIFPYNVVVYRHVSTFSSAILSLLHSSECSSLTKPLRLPMLRSSVASVLPRSMVSSLFLSYLTLGMLHSLFLAYKTPNSLGFCPSVIGYIF
jgi:hypothetical protein